MDSMSPSKTKIINLHWGSNSTYPKMKHLVIHIFAAHVAIAWEFEQKNKCHNPHILKLKLNGLLNCCIIASSQIRTRIPINWRVIEHSATAELMPQKQNLHKRNNSTSKRQKKSKSRTDRLEQSLFASQLIDISWSNMPVKRCKHFFQTGTILTNLQVCITKWLTVTVDCFVLKNPKCRKFAKEMCCSALIWC